MDKDRDVETTIKPAYILVFYTCYAISMSLTERSAYVPNDQTLSESTHAALEPELEPILKQTVSYGNAVLQESPSISKPRSETKLSQEGNHQDGAYDLSQINTYKGDTKAKDGRGRPNIKMQVVSIAAETVHDQYFGNDSAEVEREDAPREMHHEELRDELYLDPTPKTPRQGTSPSRGMRGENETQGDDGSTSEIQSIMDQFDGAIDDSADEEHEAVTSPRSQSLLGAPVQHPPRRSSLEPLTPTTPHRSSTVAESTETSAVANSRVSTADTIARTGSPQLSNLPQSSRVLSGGTTIQPSPASTKSLPRLPPPQPDPEPDLTFDFHRFLEQLRHRTADPVAKFLRSFLIEFGKKQWMVHEQVKIINDFLTFITKKMAQCEIWRGVNDAEFDNAKEGMEKLVMNRLYAQTFSPAIQPPAPLPPAKGKRRNAENLPGLGRRGQHQEDIERDEILGQKVRIYGWVQEEHLDIPPVGDNGRRFLLLAQQGIARLRGSWKRPMTD